MSAPARAAAMHYGQPVAGACLPQAGSISGLCIQRRVDFRSRERVNSCGTGMGVGHTVSLFRLTLWYCSVSMGLLRGQFSLSLFDFLTGKILRDHQRGSAICDETCSNTSIRPAAFARMTMCYKHDQIRTLLLHHVMEGCSYVITHNQTRLEINSKV